jgi:glyoxylase-like metal-dependent hydrolase (beta-lactamase superfamily II)
MSKNIYPFKIGHFQCYAINDGIRRSENPIRWLYPDVPKPELAPALRAQKIEMEKWSEWISDNTCLAIKTETHNVLIDTGSGTLEPTTGLLPGELRNVGLGPENIDIVIHTHAHPDHIGGNTVDSGSKPGYPQARFFIRKREYDYWMSKPNLDHLKFPPDLERLKPIICGFPLEYLLPIRNQLHLVDRDMEIVPGIFALEANGHTPGHMAVAVSSGGQQLLVVGDALIMPVNVEHPTWNCCPDVLKEQAVATRYRLLVRAAAGNALVLGFHMPFPGLGHAISESGKWKWQAWETIKD